jgi:hypothetical protein
MGEEPDDGGDWSDRSHAWEDGSVELRKAYHPVLAGKVERKDNKITQVEE